MAYLFDKKGVVVVDSERYSEDDLMVAIDAGAEDIGTDDDVFEITCEPADLTAVRAALDEAGIEVESAEVAQLPKTRVELDEDGATKLHAADRRAGGPRRRRRRARELRRAGRDPRARRRLAPPPAASARRSPKASASSS